MLWKILKAIIRFIFWIGSVLFILVGAMTVEMALPVIGLFLVVFLPIIVIIRMFGFK